MSHIDGVLENTTKKVTSALGGVALLMLNAKVLRKAIGMYIYPMQGQGHEVEVIVISPHQKYVQIIQ